jgi:hypothetical protein
MRYRDQAIRALIVLIVTFVVVWTLGHVFGVHLSTTVAHSLAGQSPQSP